MYAYPLLDLSASLAALFGCILIYRLIRKDYDKSIKKVMVFVFAMLALGAVLSASGEIIYDILYNEGEGVLPSSSIPNVIWMVSSVSMVLGYVYLSIHMYKRHGKIRRGMSIILATLIITASVVYYFARTYLLLLEETTPLDYIFIILSAAVFVSSVNVYIFFKDMENMKIPFLILAIVNLIVFISDIMYIYYSSIEVYGWLGALSDSLYILGYLLYAEAFYLLFRTLKQENKS